MKRNWWLFGIAVVAIVLFALVFSQRKAGEREVIKIGAILPLTGDAAVYGEHAQNGFEIALEEYNAHGVCGGKRIKILYEDSQADPSKAVSAFKKLVEIDKVRFILGPLSSSEVLAIAPLANRRKVIVLTPLASAPAITEAGDYIFRNVMSDLFDGAAIATYVIKEMHKKTAGILYINNDFGVGLKNSFKEKFEELGGVVKVEIPFERGEKDFRSLLLKLKRANPDVVFLVGYKEMAEILRQTKEMGLKFQFVSFSMFEDPDILRLAGDAAEGVVYTYRAFDPKSENPVVKEFVQKYTTKYGEEPDIFAALSYDGARILFNALDRGNCDVEGVKEALYNTKDFPGVVGKTTFDHNGDVIKPIGIKIVKNGKFVWLTKHFRV